MSYVFIPPPYTFCTRPFAHVESAGSAPKKAELTSDFQGTAVIFLELGCMEMRGCRKASASERGPG